MAPVRLVTGLCALLATAASAGPPPPPDEALLQLLLEESNRNEVAFRSLVERVCGHKVIQVNPAQPIDSAILEVVSQAAAQTLIALNQPSSPVRQERRINEVSRYFEEFLERFIDAHPDFECSVPQLENGNRLASGYPDLRLVHLPSGRVAYIDPKLVEADALESTLRTFYFTPRTSTNKIQDDAHHLLLGITHDGKDGAWTFLAWKLVDLYEFKIRLKAEYQAANRDLYRPELIIRSSP